MGDFQGKKQYGDKQRDNTPPPKQEKIGSFYIGKDEKGKNKIDPKLFDEKAEKIAESLKGVTGTQLRRLFDEVKRFDLLLESLPKEKSADEEWNRQEPYIRMIKSKTSYTVARQMEKASTSDKVAYKHLSDFIAEGIDNVHSPADYHVFVSLFEAVYGFYYEKAPNKANK